MAFGVSPAPVRVSHTPCRDGRATTETHDRASYFDLAPIDLGEDVAGAGEGLGESCAHADALAALTGEEKREGHRGTIRGPLIQGAEG